MTLDSRILSFDKNFILDIMDGAEGRQEEKQLAPEFRKLFNVKRKRRLYSILDEIKSRLEKPISPGDYNLDYLIGIFTPTEFSDIYKIHYFRDENGQSKKPTLRLDEHGINELVLHSEQIERWYIPPEDQEHNLFVCGLTIEAEDKKYLFLFHLPLNYKIAGKY